MMPLWQEIQLQQACTLQRGFDLPKRLRCKGTVPLVSSSGCIDTHNDAKIAGPCVITGRSGSIGSLFYIEDDCWPLNTTLYVKDFHGNDRKFIYYLLKSFDLKRFTSGAGVPTLNRNHVHSETVNIPEYITEQKRIVAILDDAFERIDTAIANTEKNLANARELFESYLNNVFSQKGEGWEEVELKEVLETQPRNGWSPPAKNHSDNGVPVLTLSAVTGFKFRTNRIKHTTAQVKEDAHYWVKNGDLFITRSNTTQLVGHVAICSGIEEPTIYPDLIMRMRVDNRKALTSFIYYQLRSERMREIIRTSATGANPTMKKIKKSTVQGLPIAYPVIEEQEQIVKRLDAITVQIQALENIYQQKLTALTELKQSILQKAFAGELTAEYRSEATIIPNH